MLIKEIMALVNAGFTKEEILTLSGKQSNTQPIDKPVEKPAEKPVEKPVEQPVKNDNSDVLNAIAELTKVIQASNIVNNSFERHEDTIEDIIGSLINPNEKE